MVTAVWAQCVESVWDALVLAEPGWLQTVLARGPAQCPPARQQGLHQADRSLTGASGVLRCHRHETLGQAAVTPQGPMPCGTAGWNVEEGPCAPLSRNATSIPDSLGLYSSDTSILCVVREKTQ